MRARFPGADGGCDSTSELSADSLVTDLRCPLFAFWGDQDEEIALGGGIQQLASSLDRRGLQHVSFPGYDHDGMLDHINEAVPSMLTWFDQLDWSDRTPNNAGVSGDG